MNLVDRTRTRYKKRCKIKEQQLFYFHLRSTCRYITMECILSLAWNKHIYTHLRMCRDIDVKKKIWITIKSRQNNIMNVSWIKILCLWLRMWGRCSSVGFDHWFDIKFACFVWRPDHRTRRNISETLLMHNTTWITVFKSIVNKSSSDITI